MPYNNTLSLTPAQLNALPPNQQSQYLNSLPPQQRAVYQQAMAQQQQSDNRLFMRKSINKIAYCPVAGGSGITAVYSPGTTLVFDLPVVGGGYAKGLLITASINVAITGTTTAAVTNAAAPFSFFQELDLNYNGAQIRTHPYICYLLDITRGYDFGALDGVIPGVGFTNGQALGNGVEAVSAIQNNISSYGTGGTFTSTPITPGISTATGTTANFFFKFYLPFNAIAPDSVPGVLPVMGVGNKPQLKLFCASGTLGLDPLLNPLSPGGTTPANAVATVQNTSTVNVDMVYLDGTNLSSPSPLQLNISNEPTLQYYWDTPLNPLNANLLQRQHVATLLEHWYVFSIVIDANSQGLSFITAGSGSSQAALANGNTAYNLNAMDLSPDSVGQINFVKYGLNTNVSINDFWQLTRRQFGQDFPPGVVPWITAPTRIVADSSNHNGMQPLNMRPGGYPAATHAYQVNQVSQQTAVAGFAATTPRVETFLVSMNYDGLRIS